MFQVSVNVVHGIKLAKYYAHNLSFSTYLLQICSKKSLIKKSKQLPFNDRHSPFVWSKNLGKLNKNNYG